MEALAGAANISEACRAAGVSRDAFYERRRRDKKFLLAARQAMATAVDALEREAWRRAIEGADEPVIHKGELCGVWVNAVGEVVTPQTPGAKLIPLTVKKYSNALAIFLLKAHRPKKYRDNHKVEHTGKVEGVIEIVRIEPVPPPGMEAKSNGVNG